MTRDTTPQAKVAARNMRELPKPLSAALAVAAVRDPALLGENIELVDRYGFGDERLKDFADELVRLSYETEHLEMDAAIRQLQARGLDPAFLTALERDARQAGVAAPFLDLNLTRERARALWKQALELLMRLESLERAVAEAARDNDLAALSPLKAERDSLRRLINSDWAAETPEEPVLPH